jgi:hypothetical protein
LALMAAVARWGRPTGRPAAPRAVRAPPDEELRQGGIAGIDPVAEDVEVLAERVDGRQLDGRHEPDRVLGGGGARFGDAVDRVVVGERQERHAGRGRGGDDGGGRERAVRARGVRLQVERRGAGGTAHPGSFAEVDGRRLRLRAMRTSRSHAA